jgi:hypothetical protein
MWRRRYRRGGAETRIRVSYVEHNKSAIQLSNNQVFHDRSKHIEVRFHFIRESIEKAKVAIPSTPAPKITSRTSSQNLSGL